MSSNNASGVRNLRAMFENKGTSDQSTSPPSRGRSPLENNIAESGRPVSKVRTSFVAVEKPGQPGQAPQWGLRKASDVSAASGLNGNTQGDLSRVTSRAATMADESAQSDLGLILKGSSFEDDKAAHVRQAKDLGQALSSGQAQKKISGLNTKDIQSQTKSTSTGSKMKSPTTATTTKSPTAQSDTSKTGQVIKPPTTRQVPSMKSEKSPISPKSPSTAKVNTTHPAPHVKGIRGGPTKIMAVMESANKAKVERAKVSPATEMKPSQIAGKETEAQPVANGVKKEPVSAKTEKVSKPSALPAAATAPTAASAARTDGPPKTLSTDDRRASAVRKDKPPPKVATTSTASSLAKRTPRTSLAPQTNGHERPKSRVSTAKDESFLARMTRPTASSQQKVHEKATKLDSPPRARKVSDKARQSLGPTKDNFEDEENVEIQEDKQNVPPEVTPPEPAAQEAKTEVPT